MLVPLLVGYLLGSASVVFAEALALYCLVRRLGRRKAAPAVDSGLRRDLSIEQRPLTYPYEKKGVVWILEDEEVSKWLQNASQVKGSKGQRSKQEIMEVTPVKKKGQIKDHWLILIDSNGSETKIELLGCTFLAVSASELPSRKWMKKYPVRVESKNRTILNGSKVCYLYFETSWEKESWCRALRLASSSGVEKLNWYIQLSKEFQTYLACLTSEYPLFVKPATIPVVKTDKSNKVDGSSSKFRYFFKRFTKRATKVNNDKSTSSSSKVDRKFDEKSLPESFLGDGSAKPSSDVVSSPDVVKMAPHHWTSPENQRVPMTMDAVPNEKFGFDEGTLCLNLLFSRIFFDIQRSTEINSLIRARIQRTLSNMRTPSYLGGISCTGLDLGDLPPYIHNMRAHPTDMSEAWAIEVDIEYSGGLVLDIETRLEVREPELQKDTGNPSLESYSSGDIRSDILEEFERYNQDLNLSTDYNDGFDRQEEDKPDVLDKSGGTRRSSYKSRWKTFLNSVANQVSQVPISLAIKVVSLRGTLRLHVKPPPSDQLWIGFTSMPEIDLKLDSSVGEHKIASTHVAMVISNRFKAAIRDNLVLPNCETVWIPWMLAEKDDWVPRHTAPFIWIRQENSEIQDVDPSISHNLGSKTMPPRNKGTLPSSTNIVEETGDRIEKNVILARPSSEPLLHPYLSDAEPRSSVSSDKSNNSSLEALKVPLRRNGESQTQSPSSQITDDSPERSPTSIVSVNGQSSRSIDGDFWGKKTGKRERMRGLGKKIGVKFEEKRRHMEEKGRHIVERMRENAKASEGSGSG